MQRITDWPAQERPREKLRDRGPQALSDAELLAILLRTGTGRQTALDLARTLITGDRPLRRLATLTVPELTRLHGIGEAKAVTVMAAIELGRRLAAMPAGEKTLLREPGDAAACVIPMLRDRTNEVFCVLVLDAMNGLRQIVQLTSGTLTASLVHPREVFKAAIDHRAASVIVVHNHPSGNPEPSREDVEVTRQLVAAGKTLGITLHDHIIVAGNRFVSLAERGLV